MKKSRPLLIPLILLLLLLTGCGNGDTADAYVGEIITSLKEEDSETFSLLLDEGIAESNDYYVLQFPEELRAPYQEFMQTAFKTISFEVANAREISDGYKVQVSYTPIHIANTLKDADNAYINSLESTDFAAESIKMLEQGKQVLEDSPEYKDETTTALIVTEGEDGYMISDDSLKSLLNSALYGYMEPYNAICTVYNERDAFQAYLDASFKGDVAAYAKHTNQSEEAVLDWYETTTFDPPSDLSSAYVSRYREAMKAILKQCNYSLGVPYTEDGTVYYASKNYLIDVTYTPNTSFVDAYNEFEQGTYYSIEEASAGLTQSLEKYAASPTYGTETSMTVSIGLSSYLSVGQEDSEFDVLANAILPAP